MEIFLAREILAEQLRADDRAVFVQQQTAIGLVRKDQLAQPENNQRINAATDDGKKERRHNRAAKFSNDGFHKLVKPRASAKELALTSALSPRRGGIIGR